MCIWSLGFCITSTCCIRGKLGTCFDSLYVHTYGRADGDVREVKPNRCWGDGREAEQAISGWEKEGILIERNWGKLLWEKGTAYDGKDWNWWQRNGFVETCLQKLRKYRIRCDSRIKRIFVDQNVESADWGQTGQSCFKVPTQDQTLVVHTTQDQTSHTLDLGRSHTSVHLLSASICATLTLTLFEEGGGGDCYVIVFDYILQTCLKIHPFDVGVSNWLQNVPFQKDSMPYLLVTTHIRLESGPCIGAYNHIRILV